MIGHLRGSLVDRGSNGVLLVDVHGVGYEVNCSVGAFASAGSGDEVHVHTHLVVREDAEHLLDVQERL
ncbi:MAG: OB-fold domain-containing protein, partial [Ilumatobacter sp.]